MAKEEEAEAGGFEVKSPRFYAGIVNDPIRDPKLQIPEKFAAEHGSQLPDKVALKLPSGAGWQVRVVRSRKGKMWFNEGWREFAKFYSLATDHLLFFEYDGVGSFLVCIFDSSATEIVYRTHQEEAKAVPVVKLEYGVDSCNDRPQLRSPQPPSKLRRRTVDNDHFLGEYLEGKSDQNPNGVSLKKEEPITFDEKPNHLARADAASKPRNGPSSGNTSGNPRKRSSHGKSDQNLIVASQKREEPITFDEKPSPPARANAASKPRNGSTYGNPRKRSRHGEKLQQHPFQSSADALELANAFTSDRPFFKAVMARTQLSKTQGLVTIPVASHKHLGEARKAELWFAGKCWGVNIIKCSRRNDKRMYISAGWRAFAEDNSLKLGDVCVYELLKSEADDADARREMIVLIMHIFRV
ncbi:B3 domain-containing transcription factor VRN1 [Linum perenne]